MTALEREGCHQTCQLLPHFSLLMIVLVVVVMIIIIQFTDNSYKSQLREALKRRHDMKHTENSTDVQKYKARPKQK
jgi:hypothetical protein